MLNAQSATGCIYKITCTKTNQNYIGRTMNVKERWSSHSELLRKGKHHSHKLQDAFWRYGESCLQYEVIETGIESADLSNREAYWMKEHKGYGDGFNIQYVGHPNGKPVIAASIKPSKLSSTPPAPLTVVPTETPKSNPPETTMIEIGGMISGAIAEVRGRQLAAEDEVIRLRTENEILIRENAVLRWRLGDRSNEDRQIA